MAGVNEAKGRHTVILDLETVQCPDVPFKPKEGLEDRFPPAPHHKIVAAGLLHFENFEPKEFEVWDSSEKETLHQFAELMKSQPTLVTWNGLGFDLPVIMTRSLKHGIAQPDVFLGRGYHYRYSAEGQLDLKDWIVLHQNRMAVSLDTAAALCGIEGKGDTTGADVAELYAAGKTSAIAKYVSHDCWITAHVWLRFQRLTGSIPIERLDQAARRLDKLAEESGVV